MCARDEWVRAMQGRNLARRAMIEPRPAVQEMHGKHYISIATNRIGGNITSHIGYLAICDQGVLAPVLGFFSNASKNEFVGLPRNQRKIRIVSTEKLVKHSVKITRAFVKDVKFCVPKVPDQMLPNNQCVTSTLHQQQHGDTECLCRRREGVGGWGGHIGVHEMNGTGTVGSKTAATGEDKRSPDPETGVKSSQSHMARHPMWPCIQQDKQSNVNSLRQ